MKVNWCFHFANMKLFTPIIINRKKHMIAGHLILNVAAPKYYHKERGYILYEKDRLEKLLMHFGDASMGICKRE